MKLRLIACAALIAASPLVSTFAAEPSIGADNNKESTAVKDGAANNTHGAGYSSTMPMTGNASTTGMAPVGSGKVPGDNSTVAGDAAGTAVARSGAGGADGNK